MCGIAGIFAYGDAAAPVDGAELLRIREAMRPRGPDGEGLWISVDGRVGLAHRRLGIIDLNPTGLQPMATADQALRITFNGEIYNYRELRSRLEARGHVFRTESDTEVILHLYRERGPDAVLDLRGMYALAIWDENRKGLFMARDPFGIKPLYFADDGSTVRVASQVKALLAGRGISTTPDYAGQAGFLVWGAVPEPHTLHREVRSLSAGSTLWIDRAGRKSQSRFFDLNRELVEATAVARDLSAGERRERLRAGLLESVRKHHVADVPVGLFLSSGLDSSVLAALSGEVNQGRLRSVTLGFREYKGTIHDETMHATSVASLVGTAHETRWIEKEDFEGEVEAVVAAMDQPSMDGVNTFFVARAARELGMKVALSGIGGDELFGGYPSFRDVPRIARTFGFARGAPGFAMTIRRAATPFANLLGMPKLASLAEHGSSFAGAYLLRRALFMPWEIGRFMDPSAAKQGWEELRTLEEMQHLLAGLPNDRCRVSALEISYYLRNQLLRDADWAGMAHSLEIRVPFVDVDLFRSVAPLMASDDPPTKMDMVDTLSKPLPSVVRNKRKSGFAFPVEKWAPKPRTGMGARHGLRPWSISLFRHFSGHRSKVLYFATDAFGGHGGIAQYNRDFLEAMCSHPQVGKVVAIPRLMPNASEVRPRNLQYVTSGVGSKAGFVGAALRVLLTERDFAFMVCAHINLLPLATFVSKALGIPCVLTIYGIDAWKAPRSAINRWAVQQVRVLVSISEVTYARFRQWAPPMEAATYILPNAIRLDAYGAGPKPQAMLERLGLLGKTVLLTLGRMDGKERYKGFDEVLEAMPSLLEAVPDLVYVVAGDGNDRSRLEALARDLGIVEHVRFTGYVPDEEKADLYRCADAYVMPSRGEGFGFVFLEALASGIPAVGSRVDGSREALRDGLLGAIVEPDNAEQLRLAVLEAIAKPKVVPEGLAHFGYRNFEIRLHDMVSDLLAFPAPRLQQKPLLEGATQ